MNSGKTMKHKNLDKCNDCGMCNATCPIYSIEKNEAKSPRQLVKLAKENKYDSRFFMFPSDNSSYRNCPVNVEIDFEGVRELLSSNGKETEANKQMKANMKNKARPHDPKSKNNFEFYS